MKKVSKREGKGGKRLPPGGAGLGKAPLKPGLPGGEYKIPGARGYAVGGKGIFSPAAFLIAGLAGGGAVGSALLLQFGVVTPSGAKWVLYGGLVLAGLVFLWEGRRRLGGKGRGKRAGRGRTRREE